MADFTEKQPTVGIIGMGEMGRMYAKRLAAGGIKNICVCDKSEAFERLKSEFDGTGIQVFPNGHHVSRISDLVVYSVEAEFIDAVVKEYGPSTKVGAIVSGQTSVKAPEREAFEKHLPADVSIVSVHSLHGPTVTTEGQPFIIIQHRATDDKVRLVEEVFRSFKSNYIYLTYDEHDLVTANTQAVTHAAFLTMGTAWHCSKSYPWETTRYVRGIETVKVNIALRIYSNKWHVYAGLAILNPSARTQIEQYAQSTSDLFKLMIEGRTDELRQRVYRARKEVFGWAEGVDGGFESDEHSSKSKRKPILLSSDILDQFSLGSDQGSTSPPSPNSHLSLLAMVDCWAALGIHPFEHLDVAGTPVFMLWIGVAEYLFRSTTMLDSALKAAIEDRTHRSDDTEFVIAARGWSQCVSFGSFELYRRRFEETRDFFAPRFAEATKVGGQMIKVIQAAQAQAAAQS